MSTLPDGWSIAPFESVATYASGRTPARANPMFWSLDDERVSWVAISDMEAYGTITKTSETISGKAFREVFRSRILPPGTLLMSFKLTIGRIATLGIPACHNEAIISINPRPGIDQRYLAYFLSQVDYSDLQDRQIKGNTLNQDKINRIPVVLPPEPEQKLIADMLDVIRANISIEKRAQQLTLELQHATMHELFTGGLSVKSKKESEDCPESWLVEPLSNHFSVASGGTPSRRVPSYWEGGSIPWVKTTEVNYCVITETEEHITAAGLQDSAAKLFPEGTLLMAMYGQGVTRGKVAILGIKAACNQACAAINSIDQCIQTKFLFHFLTYKYEEIRQLAHGGQQQNLNSDIVRNFLISYPPNLEEQREIVAILDAVNSKIDAHKRKHAVLNELFETLLPKFMTGEIRIEDGDARALTSPYLSRVHT